MSQNNCLHEISKNVTRLLGLHFPDNRFNELERLVICAARELRMNEDLESINKWLSKRNIPDSELNVLSEHLRVGETYFFRENTALLLFKDVIIPQVMELRKGSDQQIRIWSAGCSSGEEPYSLAIILRETFPDIKNWKITILATDISLRALNKAIQGKYTSWSFRQTEQHIKDKYFVKCGKEWEIIPEIKQMVTFSHLNLAEEVYDSAATNTNHMDVIFCRNVLMYFTPDKARAVSLRFYNSLVDQGWFVSSQVELSEDYFAPFLRVNYQNGIFYKKSAKVVATKLIPSSIKTQKAIHTHRLNTLRQTTVQPSPKLQPTKAKVKTIHIDTPLHPERYFERGMYQKCIDQCLEIIEKHPDSVNCIMLLVKSFANMGQLEKAKYWGNILLSKNRISADMYLFVATIFFELGELAAAEIALKKTLYLDHNNVSALFTLGNVMYRQGKKNMASKYFENAYKILEIMEEEKMVSGFEGLTAGRVKQMVSMTLV